MTPSFRFMFGLAAAGALGLSGRVTCARLLHGRRPDPVELEKARRRDIERRGRIAGARVVDSVELETNGGKTWFVIYAYEVDGVTYEAAQGVTAPETGQVTSVKYDPLCPANSILNLKSQISNFK